MKLDRQLQKELLEKMANAYPNRINVHYITSSTEEGFVAKYVANMAYLEEHGLAHSGLHRGLSDISISDPKITAKGMDFIADDGGLSAILGTVTVKLHDETLRALLALTIEKADLTQPDKQKLLDELRELPAESIKHLTLKLLDKGLESLPAALAVIQTAMQAVLP